MKLIHVVIRRTFLYTQRIEDSSELRRQESINRWVLNRKTEWNQHINQIK